MKKILVFLWLVSSLLVANDATIFTEEQKGTYSAITNDMLLLLYPNIDVDTITLDAAKRYFEKEICQDKEQRTIIDSGRKAVFIYPKNKKRMLVVVIDSCSKE